LEEKEMPAKQVSEKFKDVIKEKELAKEKEKLEKNETKEHKDVADKLHKEQKEHKEHKERKDKHEKERKDIVKEFKQEGKELEVHPGVPQDPTAAAAEQMGVTPEEAATSAKLPDKVKTEKFEKFEKHEKFEKFEKFEKHEKLEHFEYKVLIDTVAVPPVGPVGPGPVEGGGSVEQRLAALEAAMAQLVHFIPQELRPDLSKGALKQEEKTAQTESEPTPGQAKEQDKGKK
jgi:hypothetical protein